MPAATQLAIWVVVVDGRREPKLDDEIGSDVSIKRNSCRSLPPTSPDLISAHRFIIGVGGVGGVLVARLTKKLTAGR